MIKIHKSVIVLLSVCALLMSCNRQSNKGHHLYGNSVSELSSSVMVIYQDQRGHYWFGSWDEGLYRYNGQSLVNFTTDHGLPTNRIDDIKEDEFGNLYITSCHPKSTITKYDGTKFTRLEYKVSADWELQSKDLWFRHAFQTEKVYRYDGTNLYELTIPKPPNLENSFEVYSIYKDRKGNIWFGTNPVGVCRFDGTSFDWIIEEDVTEFRDEGANGVRSITEDASGDFWFNTEFRYSVYDSVTISRGKFYSRHRSLGGLDGKRDSHLDEYLSIVKDDEDNLWFVSYRDGVWKYDGSEITQYVIKEGNQTITTYSIYLDNNDELWLGTHENGVYKFNGTHFEKFTL